MLIEFPRVCLRRPGLTSPFFACINNVILLCNRNPLLTDFIQEWFNFAMQSLAVHTYPTWYRALGQMGSRWTEILCKHYHLLQGETSLFNSYSIAFSQNYVQCFSAGIYARSAIIFVIHITSHLVCVHISYHHYYVFHVAWNNVFLALTQLLLGKSIYHQCVWV